MTDEKLVTEIFVVEASQSGPWYTIVHFESLHTAENFVTRRKKEKSNTKYRVVRFVRDVK